jgi:hypothetical protein
MIGGWKFPPPFPGFLTWWLQRLREIVEELEGVFRRDYVLTWWLGEFLFFLVGLNLAWSNLVYTPIAAGIVYAIGFGLFMLHRNLTPWLFSLNLILMSFCSGYTAASFLRLVSLSLSTAAAGGIISVDTLRRKGGNMAHVPNMTGPQRLTSHVLSAIGIAVAFVLAAYLPGLAAWFQAGLAVMSAVTLLSLLNRNLQRKQRFIRLGFAIAMAVAAGLVPMLPGLVR